jgi:hypothetical protein
MDAQLIGIACLIVVEKTTPGTEISFGELSFDQTKIASLEIRHSIAITNISLHSPIKNGIVEIGLFAGAPGTPSAGGASLAIHVAV